MARKKMGGLPTENWIVERERLERGFNLCLRRVSVYFCFSLPDWITLWLSLAVCMPGQSRFQPIRLTETGT